MRRQHDLVAVEIDGDDASWLRGQSLPDGAEIVETDEVEHFGAVYDRAPGSLLYVPAGDDAVNRVIQRKLATAPKAAKPVGVSLFTGAGGFDLGMHEAGFDVVAAVEWDFSASITYLHNLGHPNCQIIFASDEDRVRWEKGVSNTRRKSKSASWPDLGSRAWIGAAHRATRRLDGGCRAFFFGDISRVTGAQIMAAVGVEKVDIVFGGPPCQGLSTANSKACLEDPRNGMIWEYMRLVDEIRPSSFMIENVPAILTVAKGALFNAIAQLANDAGYSVVATKLDAASYGVPQHRVRAIIVGTDQDTPRYRYPMPTSWAVGRPVDDAGWTQLDDERGPLQKRLPPQAHYDREKRTWSFYDSEPPAVAPLAATSDQMDLLAGGAL